MRASLALQRHSESQLEAVWHRPVGPVWWHSGSLSLENSVPWSSHPVRRFESRCSGAQKSSPEGGSTSQQPQRLAMWQLLSRLQLQNWTLRSSTNSPMTSDPSFLMAQSVLFLSVCLSVCLSVSPVSITSFLPLTTLLQFLGYVLWYDTIWYSYNSPALTVNNSHELADDAVYALPKGNVLSWRQKDVSVSVTVITQQCR